MLPDGSGSGLFLSPVPVPPGDPGALSRAAATYTAAHGELDRNRATLTSAVSQAGTAAWLGNGAVSYGAATGALAVTYAMTAATVARAATTLRAFAADLTTAQATARQANAAVAVANAAASAMLGAQAEADQAQSAAQDAAQTSATADAAATASPHSPPAQLAAQTAKTTATSAQNAASSAQGRAATLTAAWEADYSRAVTLSDQATQQAKHAASQASAGFDAAASALVGPATTARGGAKGVTGSGSSPWSTVISDIWSGNDKAGWGLNALGAYSLVLLTPAEVREFEAKAAVTDTGADFDAVLVSVWTRQSGNFNSWAPSWSAFDGAIKDEKAANKALLAAIRPGSDDPLTFMKGFGQVGLGLGMVSDVLTFIHPSTSYGPDGKLGGNFDRGVVAANFAASGIALGDSVGIAAASGLMLVPGVNLVVGGVLIGTSAYLAGEFVYQHWGTITHGLTVAADAVGHAGDAVGHYAKGAADSLVDSARQDLDVLMSGL
jgi:hypothetical protein